MLVDAHAHIDGYTGNLEAAISQINSRRILTVAVSMDIPSYERTVEIATGCRYIVPTFGIHPWKAELYCKKLSQLDDFLKKTPFIGEAGLDFFWVEDRKKDPGQRAVFEYQCEWARRLSKPMNLHTKGAEREIVATLERFGLRGCLIHWYSGPMDLIDRYLSLGCYFTVGVELLGPERMVKVAQAVPIDRLLLETDNPVGYQWLTKEEGMPELVFGVLEELSKTKEMNPVELEDQLWRNWRDFTKDLDGIAETHT